MDNDRLILRTAALQLQVTDSKEVVKIAGIIQDLQHWVKKITDPEYRARVLKMDLETKDVQKFITKLDQELGRLRLAIRTGDLDSYNKSLEETKKMSLQFWDKIKDLNQKSESVAKIMKYYTKNDINRRNFMKKFKDNLQPEYDLDLSADNKKKYNIPLKSVGWYKSLTPDMIAVTGSGTIEIVLKIIQGKLGPLAGKENLIFKGDKLQILFDNIRQAIVDGTLIGVSYRKFGPLIKTVAWGTTEIEVATAPFEIPETGAAMTLIVTLEDPRTSKIRKSDDKLVWVTSKSPKIIKLPKVKPIEPQVTAGERQQFLQKIALSSEVPVQYTILNEIQFAKILREGYLMAFGTDPTAQVLAGGWAQAVLESGRPIKLPNNNIGNIKATSDWIKSGNSYFIKGTSEFTSDGKKYDDHTAKWRAYSSPQAGAAGYWKLIGNKYKDAMDWMAAGDPTSATVSLAMKKYFTANIEKYAKGVSSLYQEFMTKIAPQLPNLNSVVASPPGEKLPLKPWLKEYTSHPTNNSKSTTSNTEVDKLLQTLYSSPGPIEKFVKNALLEQVLPRTDFVILIQGSDCTSKVEKLEYAKAAVNILNTHLEVTAKICSNDKDIEIQGSTLGTPVTVTKTIQVVCDCISEALNYSSKNLYNINAIVVPGFLSKYSQVSEAQIEKNSRLFQLKRLS